MRLRSIGALGVAAALLACGGGAQGPAADPSARSTTVVGGFRVPRQTGPFALDADQLFEDPRLGFQLRYTVASLPAARADVFVYPVVVPELFSVADALDAQQRALQDEIRQRAETGGYDEIVLREQRERSVPAPPGAPLRGIASDFQGRIEGHPVRSYAFLAIRGRHYLKARFTLPAEQDAAGRAAFDEFLRAVLTALAPAAGADRPSFRITATRTTMEVAAHGNPCAGAVWAYGYGPVMATLLQEGAFLDSHDRELRAREAAVELWERVRQAGAGELKARDCRDRSLDEMVEARRRGLFEEYVWAFYAKPYWQRPDGLDLAAFAAWSGRLRAHDPVPDPGVVLSYSAATGGGEAPASAP